MPSLILLAFLCIPVVFAAPWNPNLGACANQLSYQGLTYGLVRAAIIGRWLQCDYLHFDSTGGSSGTYCFYDYASHALTHYPNTPLRVDSNPSCPDPYPQAQTYLIKTSDTGKCLTIPGSYDGAPVQIQDCLYRNGNPNQKWHFQGSLIQPTGTNKCLDVTNGGSANGVKLQVWTCVDGNANQQFQHSDPNVVILPEDHISWMLHPNLCMDLTDGRLDNGNQIQLWACDGSNPNQRWYLEATT
ncbi:ricin B lectin domain-containing protein [Cyathus striatus]|nr:ricin B lectin domain-containing protein [Cyathus striatus]